jgi:hypothetical protein
MHQNYFGASDHRPKILGLNYQPAGNASALAAGRYCPPGGWNAFRYLGYRFVQQGKGFSRGVGDRRVPFASNHNLHYAVQDTFWPWIAGEQIR